MIAAVGLRNLVENKVNLSNNRNLLIVSVIFTLGVGGIALNFGQYSFQGVGPAAIIGIFLNLVLPKDKEEEVSVK
jgi:uracil permease